MSELFAFGDTGWGDELLAGLLVTLQLALASLLLGLLIGFLIAAATLSNHRWLRWLGYSYSTLMRGLPELLTLFVVYNGVGLLLNELLAVLAPESAAIDFSPFIAGVIALGMVFGAFASEVLRGAFNSLDPGQSEAGRAVGMSHWQVFRRIRLPQAWRYALPGLGNLWVNLIKDTSLVSIIALDDLMRMTKVAVGATKLPFTFYLMTALIYWGLCVFSELVLGRLELRANRGMVGAGAKSS